MEIPTPRFTRRLDHGNTGIVYRYGKGHVAKVLSHEFIRKHILPKADRAEQVSEACYTQLMWEHTTATALRDAGIKSAVQTYGVREVQIRWSDTRMRAVNRLALIMDFAPGVPITCLDEIAEPVARWRLGEELRKARQAGYVPDTDFEDPGDNALYDEHTSRITLVDFTLWTEIKDLPYKRSHDNYLHGHEL